MTWPIEVRVSMGLVSPEDLQKAFDGQEEGATILAAYNAFHPDLPLPRVPTIDEEIRVGDEAVSVEEVVFDPLKRVVSVAIERILVDDRLTYDALCAGFRALGFLPGVPGTAHGVAVRS